MAEEKLGAPKGELNKENGKKILRGATIAMGGALCTYLLEIIPGLDFGSLTPMVVGIISILINTIRETLKNK